LRSHPVEEVVVDVVDLHARSVEWFVDKVRAVPDDGWGRFTPDADWDVRALVNHVVGEDRWTAPLVAGRTIEEVGDRLDGDLLGELPVQAAEEAAKEAVTAFGEFGAIERTVHLSFGDTPAAEYAWQLTADHLVHGWDLAVAVGAPARMDPQLVEPVAGWFAEREELYRGAGAIASRPELTPHDPQEALLVAFGRDPAWSDAVEVVRRFGAAWEAWDLEAVMSWMADDAVFESTGPAPDGQRAEGAPAIRAVWEPMFRDTPQPRFTFEESFVKGDRASARWRFAWSDPSTGDGHVRGADVLRVRDGKIAEKLSYVKG
jgi:uncharacterized protein (TIGR03086 family)